MSNLDRRTQQTQNRRASGGLAEASAPVPAGVAVHPDGGRELARLPGLLLYEGIPGRALYRGRELRVHSQNGYPHVAFAGLRGGLHRLICEAWHGEPSGDRTDALHWNDQPEDNRAANLRWGSTAENGRDRKRNAAERPTRAIGVQVRHDPSGWDSRMFSRLLEARGLTIDDFYRKLLVAVEMYGLGAESIRGLSRFRIVDWRRPITRGPKRLAYIQMSALVLGVHTCALMYSEPANLLRIPAGYGDAWHRPIQKARAWALREVIGDADEAAIEEAIGSNELAEEEVFECS